MSHSHSHGSHSHGSHSHGAHSHGADGECCRHVHVVPPKFFAVILGILMVLTVVTVLLSGVQFSSPSYNLIFAMVIASIKASLVVMFFMHLKYENPLTWIYALFPIILLFVLLGGVFIDNPMRETNVPVTVQAPAALAK